MQVSSRGALFSSVLRFHELRGGVCLIYVFSLTSFSPSPRCLYCMHRSTCAATLAVAAALLALVGPAHGDEDLQFQNTLLGELSFECMSGYALNRVGTVRETTVDGIPDRRWMWGCKKVRRRARNGASQLYT